MPSSQPAAGHLAIQPQYLSSQPSPMAKTSEPNRSKSYDPKKPHITETALTRKNWYKHVNWLNVVLIVGIPLYGLVQAWWVPLQWKTAVWAVAYYFMTGLGITAGMIPAISCSPFSILTTRRLSSTLGTHVLLRYRTPSYLLGCCWRWSGRRIGEMVGERPSCSSPLHRHRQRPILGSQRPPLLSFRLDGHEAKPKADRSH